MSPARSRHSRFLIRSWEKNFQRFWLAHWGVDDLFALLVGVVVGVGVLLGYATWRQIQASGNVSFGLVILTTPECRDTQDNDADGLVDYPYDPECDSEEDRSESPDPTPTPTPIPTPTPLVTPSITPTPRPTSRATPKSASSPSSSESHSDSAPVETPTSTPSPSPRSLLSFFFSSATPRPSATPIPAIDGEIVTKPKQTTESTSSATPQVQKVRRGIIPRVISGVMNTARTMVTSVATIIGRLWQLFWK